MKPTLTRVDALPLAEHLARALEAAHDELTALDAAVGDGDLGVTCRLGMRAVLQLLPTLPEAPLGELLTKGGLAFNAAGASTYGALVATGALRAGAYTRAHGETWDLATLTGALTAAAEGIQQRGKAARGDKTLLDALWPALDALQAAQQAGAPLATALAAAATAAAQGAVATTPLRAKFGRAAWMQERTLGVQDAGATVVAVVLQALAEYAAG